MKKILLRFVLLSMFGCLFTSCDTALTIMQGLSDGLSAFSPTYSTTGSYGESYSGGQSSSKEWHNCSICGGSGRCKYCGGSGRDSSTRDGKCHVCSHTGNGKCAGCNGSGGYSI